MQDLVKHVVQPIVSHPDAIAIKAVEGESVLMLELSVHPEDRPLFEGDNDVNLRAIRNVLSAAAGSRKATIELVALGDEGAGEE